MKNIKAKIDKKTILNNISLDFFIGENITILGPNGSGKSTLIKLINRSIYPIVEKHSIFKLFNKTNINLWELRSKIGFLHSDIQNRIKNKSKSIDVVLSGLDSTIGRPKSETKSKVNIEKAQIIMNRLSLNNIEELYFNQLSDGQQRKVLISRALINNPIVLIFDEPFIGLDINSKYSIFNIIRNLSSQGISIILATNNIDNIITNTNRIICLKSGKLYKDGSPKEILTSSSISNLYDTKVDIIFSNGYWRTVPKIDI